MDRALISARNLSNNGFPGDDFSNNLFTDLAPLLALFGDQMTKQFLSMSMSWADNALVAICPIGILTIVVSAIRIGGTSKLKTLIGRARESRSTAELELLSATSAEVCEMWSGSEIVRVAGQPATIQYILDKSVTPAAIMTVSEALKQNIYHQSSGPTDLENSNAAPNLTLNVQDAISLSWEILTFTVIGMLIQIVAFVLSAFIEYGWSLRAGSDMISSYGFPCYLVGTVLLTCGLLGCARVIQNDSRIDELFPKNSLAKYQPLYVQKACTVDDKQFHSYAIFHPEGRSTINVSRRNGRNYNLVTLCSTATALLGYVLQFVGLRAMHWSVALIQLAATLTMTCARAFIRRGLANKPICQPLPMGTDAVALAHLFCQTKSWELVTGTSTSNEPTHATLSDVGDSDPDINAASPFQKPGKVTADPNSSNKLSSASLSDEETANPSNDLIMTARTVGQNVPTEYPTSLLAERLAKAIRAIMGICSQRQVDGVLTGESLDCNEHFWALQPLLRMKEENVMHPPIKTILYSIWSPQRVERSRVAELRPALTADPATLSAILSLWLAVLARRYPLNRVRAGDENETLQRPQYYRIISNDCVPPGVPQGKAIRKWLSSQTTLHTTTVTQLGQLATDRQARKAPMFGISFSSRYLRFRAVPE